MMRFLLIVLALALTGTVSAGEVNGDSYIGERFGRLELVAPASQWQILDREDSGANEFGGPVVDLKATAAISGFFPTLHVSAFKRADATVTPEFVLQTSRDAVLKKGGEPGPVQLRAVNGRKVWFFEAQVGQQNSAACLYYVLLEGVASIYALQTVVPEEVLLETKQRVDELLYKVNY